MYRIPLPPCQMHFSYAMRKPTTRKEAYPWRFRCSFSTLSPFVDTNTCWGSELTTDADTMLSPFPRGTCTLLRPAGPVSRRSSSVARWTRSTPKERRLRRGRRNRRRRTSGRSSARIAPPTLPSFSEVLGPLKCGLYARFLPPLCRVRWQQDRLSRVTGSPPTLPSSSEVLGPLKCGLYARFLPPLCRVRWQQDRLSRVLIIRQGMS
jgi:hypothetical protein